MNRTTILSLLAVSCVGLSGCGALNNWSRAQHIKDLTAEGQAELAQADGNRQIKVQEAKAAYESADYTAKAEVRKAEGVAAANKIMSESLGGPEGYLRWKYIEMLETTKNSQVIYVPTEAGLPILEAGHRTVVAPAAK